MVLDIFNVDDFIKANNVEQVTNPISFNPDKTPTTDGLFSYEIFGQPGSLKRKAVFGYIQLNKHYLHPAIYSIFLTRMGSLKDILTYKKYAKVINGEIIYTTKDDKDAEAGVDFFYNNHDKIDWEMMLKGAGRTAAEKAADLAEDLKDELEVDKDSGFYEYSEDAEIIANAVEESDYIGQEGGEEVLSLDRTTRFKIISLLKRDEMFMDKCLVLPAFYRDMALGETSLGDTINNSYKELLTRSLSAKNLFGFSMLSQNTDMRIQSILLEIYMMLTKMLKGKNSILRRSLIGKVIDYSASNVMVAPVINKAKSPAKMKGKFGEGYFPLSTVITAFAPFIENELYNQMEFIMQAIAALYPRRIGVDIHQFTNEDCHKMIKMYAKSPEKRFTPITYTIHDKEKDKDYSIGIMMYYSTTNNVNNAKSRLLTLADVIYIAAINASQDKHIYVTRYPIINFQNIYPTRVKILTTPTTQDLYIWFDKKGSAFKVEDYPLIPDVEAVNGKVTEFTGEDYAKYEFADTAVIGNANLKGLDGDYDGDMIFLKGVFSKEANDEAEKLIDEKMNLFNAAGALNRSIAEQGKDVVFSLYMFTKEVPLGSQA